MPKNNLRDIIFERESYTCVLCTNAATDLHHVTPRSQAGRNIPQNLVALCRRHHDTVHGVIWNSYVQEFTQEEAMQTILEYVSDYYAE